MRVGHALHRPLLAILAILAVTAASPLIAASAQPPSPSGTILYAVWVRPATGETPQLFDLRSVHFPYGRPRSLFAKTLPQHRPLGKITEARWLAGGKQVLMCVSRWRWHSLPEKGWGELWLLDVRTGSTRRLATGIGLLDELPFIMSPDRKTAVFRGIRLWTAPYGVRRVQTHANVDFFSVTWAPGAARPTAPLDETTNASYWVDPKTGRLIRPKPSDHPPIDTVAFIRDQWLLLDTDSQQMFLVKAGGEKIQLHRKTDVDAFWRYESIFADFSPDRKYIFWMMDRRAGEAMFCAGESFIFDISGPSPTTVYQAIEDDDHDVLVSGTSFAGWSTKPSGIFLAPCLRQAIPWDQRWYESRKVDWLSLPTLTKRTIATLPKRSAPLDIIEGVSW